MDRYSQPYEKGVHFSLDSRLNRIDYRIRNPLLTILDKSTTGRKNMMCISEHKTATNTQTWFMLFHDIIQNLCSFAKSSVYSQRIFFFPFQPSVQTEMAFVLPKMGFFQNGFQSVNIKMLAWWLYGVNSFSKMMTIAAH